MIFDDQELIDAIKNRQYFYKKNAVDIEWDEFQWTYITSTTSAKHQKWYKDDNSAIFEHLQEKSSFQDWAKDILQELQEYFPRITNTINIHAFCGFGPNSQSFTVHRDDEDVLYLQVYGEVNWSIWSSNSNKNILDSHEEGTRIATERLRPGDLVWVPRRVYHMSEPISTRVGYSFGIHGEEASKSILA